MKRIAKPYGRPWNAQQEQHIDMEGGEWQQYAPVSHICALTVFPSTSMVRVANSTPMVDFESRLNSLRVKRESTDNFQSN